MQFETIFMTEPQVKKCEDIFVRKVKSSNSIFLAWEALKTASLPLPVPHPIKHPEEEVKVRKEGARGEWEIQPNLR